MPTQYLLPQHQGQWLGSSTTTYTYSNWVPNNSTASTLYYYPHRWVDDGNQYRPIITQNGYCQNHNPTYITTTAPTYTFTDEVWQTWVSQYPVTWGSGTVARPETPEERQARRERQRTRQAACTRARILLGEFLDDEQKVELEKKGQFHVTGSKGRRYCIRTTSQSGNVDLLKPDGSVQATLCCHPRNYLPDGDAWLMQMIELRHDEDHFLRTANVHRGSLAGVR